VLCCGCNKSPVKNYHPEYFSRIFKIVDTTQNENKDAAIAFLDSAFKAFPNPGIFDFYARDSIKADIYSYVKHDNMQAEAYADSMMMLVEKRTDEEEFAEKYARALYYKGHYFRNLKRYEQAIHFYTLAKEAELKNVKNKCSLRDCAGSVANLLYEQGKFIEAAHHYLQNYRLHLLCLGNTYKELMEIQASIANAGQSYQKAGMPDSASCYYTMGLNFIAKNEQKFPANYYSTNNAKGVIYAYQAEILLAKKDFIAAEELFNKSIEATASADIFYTQSTQIKLVKIYVENKQLEKATQLLNQLKPSLDSLSNEKEILNWYQLKTAYHTKLKETNAAYESLQQYVHIKDSFETRDKKFSEINVSKNFEDIEQEYTMAILKKDNEVKTTYLFISLIVTVMAIIIILLVWLNLRRSGKHVRDLKLLNLEVENKNKDLQKAFISLEQSHNENTRIMKVVAHDLKNPISAIYSMMHLLLDKEQPEFQKEIFKAISASCINSLALIKDLLDEKEPDAVKEPVNISALLEYCVQLLQAKADEKYQELKLHTEDSTILINRQKIWRVISNLINNAIKFSPEKSIIEITLEKKDSMILLSVHDNGIGIPAELKDKIFNQSGEYIRPGTAGEKSYGMGLSISQKIIEEHKGKIWFESKKEKGSVFFVELPFIS
jgi:signal transduction histidine kinase